MIQIIIIISLIIAIVICSQLMVTPFLAAIKLMPIWSMFISIFLFFITLMILMFLLSKWLIKAVRNV